MRVQVPAKNRKLNVLNKTGTRRRASSVDLHAWGCDRSDCFIQHAVAGLAIGMILIDPKSRVVWLNRAAEQLLSMTAADCMGRNFTQLLLDPQLTAFWHEVMCHDGNCMADISIKWPRRLELKLNATQCLGPDGVEIGRALLFCDVTSDRNVTIELTKEMTERLLAMQGVGSEPPTALASLTASELRTLRLLARGMTNDAIAKKLCVASSTVRSHLKSVYSKLNLHSRAEAVSFAARQGLA
jgi:DNA-binding CsgD family transcriptional regulator